MLPRFLVSAALLVTAARPAAAQDVHGMVRDSASGTPIAGVVVVLASATGTTVGRTITSERGLYRIAVPASATQLDFLRIGFRRRTLTVPADTARAATFDVTMTSLPSMLSDVRVAANPRCEGRSDREDAHALWQQARAALTASVVARERAPVALTHLAYERAMDAIGVNVLHQVVRLESASATPSSFFAVRTATDFMRSGFRANVDGRQTYYSPDADVMLDDAFANGYCFQLAKPVATRATQIGLEFEPANRQRGRVDIAGALWIDTTMRSLVDLEFRYLGVDESSAALGAGGRVSFRTLANGVIVIDRWNLRLVGSPDPNAAPNEAGVPRLFLVREVGGELAHATWENNGGWASTLGRARIRVLDPDGEPASGIVVGLTATDYRSITDNEGYADIEDLAPGPYTVFIVDQKLATLGITLPTTARFESRRGSLSLLNTLRPTVEASVANTCEKRGFSTRSNMLLARVTTEDGLPVTDVSWNLVHRLSKGPSITIGGKTDDNGVFLICDRLEYGQSDRILISRGGQRVADVDVRISERLTVSRVVVPTVKAERVVASAAPSFHLIGVVRESATGTVVPDATVSLRETPFLTETDSSGHFQFASLAPREYTLEVRTPWLDSLGTVKRLVVAASESLDPLTVYLPTETQIAAAMCGAATVPGVVVGRVETHADDVSPALMRVIVEWAEVSNAGTGVSTQRRIAADADARGTFRVCGVPLDTPLSLHAEPSEIGARPMDGTTRTALQLSASRRIMRADLLVRRRPGH